jgi:hypothetical protein
MLVVPEIRPETTPEELIVATEVLLLAHVPPGMPFAKGVV